MSDQEACFEVLFAVEKSSVIFLVLIWFSTQVIILEDRYDRPSTSWARQDLVSIVGLYVFLQKIAFTQERVDENRD